MGYIIYPEIFPKGIKAFFTGRLPGAEIKVIKEVSGINKVYFPIQRHTSKVVRVDTDTRQVIADAVITDKRGILLGVQTADCIPILIHVRNSNLIGALHAGWRGTASGILKQAVKAMLNNSKPENILIAMGPSIRGCCYEVGDDVLEEVIKETGDSDYYIKRDNKSYLDLSNANRLQALSLGIREENIWLSPECTYCNPERFYSYRYLKNETGRQGGFIGIFR